MSLIETVSELGASAVVHYDLAWNPTRHEQREGRVDRFGQQAPTVRTVTYYGEDNGIDGIVLQVLIRRHENIKRSIGVSVPIPVDSTTVMKAIWESLDMTRTTAIQNGLSYTQIGNFPPAPPAPRDKKETQYR